MGKVTRKRYTAEFKAKVALEAIKGEMTLAELAARHGIHQTMIAGWKRQAIEGMALSFSGEPVDARDRHRVTGDNGFEQLQEFAPVGSGTRRLLTKNLGASCDAELLKLSVNRLAVGADASIAVIHIEFPVMA